MRAPVECGMVLGMSIGGTFRDGMAGGQEHEGESARETLRSLFNWLLRRARH